MKAKVHYTNNLNSKV